MVTDLRMFLISGFHPVYLIREDQIITNPHIEILHPLILLLTTPVRVQCIALPADLNLLVRKGSMELITHLMRELKNLRIPGIYYLMLTPWLVIGNMIIPAYLLQ